MGNVKGFGSGPVDSTVHTLEEGAELIVHIYHNGEDQSGECGFQ